MTNDALLDQAPMEDRLLAAARVFLDGNLAEAMARCDAALAHQPGQPDFVQLRAAIQAGALPDGLDDLARHRTPGVAEAMRHHQEGRSLLARLSYETLLRAEPDHPGLLLNLAVLHLQNGRLFEGLELLDRVVDRHGMIHEANVTLTSLTKLFLEGLATLPDDAEPHFRAVAPLLPRLRQSPGAYTLLLLHFGNRAARLSRSGDYAASIGFARVAMAFDPSRFDLLFNLGFATEMGGGFDEAVAHYRRAAVAATDSSNRAYALLMLMHLFFRLGRWEEFETLLPHKYDYAPVAWWKSYLPVPIWDGTIRPGARILINGESGFGDVIQCLRYAEYFHQRGMTVCFLSDPRMKALCALGKGVAEAYTHGDRIASVDCRVQSFDLFYALERDSRRGFHSGAYIDIARSPHRAPTLDRKPGELLVGIKWTTTDPSKDIPLALFSRLLLRDGVRLISLQPEPPDEDCGLAVERPLEGCFADPAHSFVSTAWVIGQMDLVVTADSVIAHLAGAVGATAWVALRAIPDCRWLVDRSDSPFYDSLTLFRQPVSGDWSAVIDAMASELRRRLGGHAGSAPHWPPPPVLSGA